MSFKFHCDCGQKLSATDDMIGTQAFCPNCSVAITVVAPAPDSPYEPPRSGPPPILRQGEPVPPRPTGLIWGLAAFVTLGVLVWTAASFGDRFIKVLPLFLGAIIGVFLGAMFAAVFLRMAVRIVARFALPFGEATGISLLMGSLNVACALPMIALARQPDRLNAIRLPTLGVMLLLTLVCYALLIRDDLCRPVGWGKGVLIYLMNLLLTAVIVVAPVVVVWYWATR